MRTRLNQDVGVSNAITNMYAKCDSIGFVYNVFRMSHHNLVSWNTIIATFGNHRLRSRAFEPFEQLRAIGLEPNSVTFVGLLMACNHAEDYMRKYPFGQDPIVLGNLLFTCRLHGDVVMGERLAKELLKLQLMSTSPYVLLSNLYASDEIWDCVAETIKMLKGSGLKKEVGYSLVQVKVNF
ncbi:hypothetical protein CRYUN_Cryun03dG0098200 [Craigia yunnanensis]